MSIYLSFDHWSVKNLLWTMTPETIKALFSTPIFRGFGRRVQFQKKYSKSNNFVPNPHYFKDGHLASEYLYKENMKTGRMLEKTPEKDVLRFELCKCNSAAIFMSTLTDRKYVEIILEYYISLIISSVIFLL